MNYRLHPDYAYRIEEIGREGQRVVVVDNFLADAEGLIDEAASASFNPVEATIYPGVRARLPMAYPFALRDLLRELFREAFGLDTTNIVGGQTDFSIVTTPPERAHPRQLHPHFDGPDPNILAGLHYLCGASHGGTSFYRHRATGFELITRERAPAYVQTVEAEVAATPRRAHYPHGDSDLFERIASFPAAFNRLLIYRGVGLHSGDIAPDFAFDPSPRSGRLTANTFLLFRPL